MQSVGYCQTLLCHSVCVCRNAYHGASPYSYSLTSLSTWKHNVAGGGAVHQVELNILVIIEQECMATGTVILLARHVIDINDQ